MLYINKKNNVVAELVEINEKSKMVTLEIQGGGDKKFTSTTISTFKRWWRKLKDGETPEPSDVMKDVGEINVDKTGAKEVEPEPKKQKKTSTKKEPSVKKEKKDRKPRAKMETPQAILDINDYVFSRVEELEGEVWEPSKEMNFRSLKVGGHIFLKYNWSNKRVTLGCRSCAVESLGEEPSSVANHMFDVLYFITELTPANKKLIDRLIKASMKYQVQKNEKKAQKKED